jgi:hypothetical protein
MVHLPAFALSAPRIVCNATGWKMEDVQHCCVCLELYNNRSRKPLLLPCRHRLCSLCLSQQSMSACPLCRKQIDSSNDAPFPVDQQLLMAIGSLRNRMPSPSSYPIGEDFQRPATGSVSNWSLVDLVCRVKLSSPVCFKLPAGLLEDDAPGTPPHPSAPALVEVGQCK